MKQFISTLDSLDKIIKLILALPGIDIIWSIYRIVSALDKNNIPALIISVILLFIPFMWIIDLAFIFLFGNVWKYQG